MKINVCFVALVALLFLSGPLWAASPVGQWKTFDDETNQAKSIVEIYELEGKLMGKVVQILTPGEENKLCEKCPGEKKDKPILGLVILRDLSAGNGEYSGGTILDPNNGKTYSCRITVEDGGAKLKVRGFLGFALLGRTQYWHRVE